MLPDDDDLVIEIGIYNILIIIMERMLLTAKCESNHE